MADEARKTFPMSTFVSYIKGVGKDAQQQNILDFLSFVTNKDIDAEFEPFAASLVKSWIYEQHPELAKMKSTDVTGMGDNVSIAQLPGDVMVEADAIFAKLADYRKTVTEQTAKADDLEKKLAAAEAKLTETEKSLAEYKSKCEALEASGKDEGDKVIVASKELVDDYVGQVAELVKKIDDIKNGVATMAVAAPAAGAAADGAAAGAPETGGEPEADFGFGSDPFGDSSW